MSTLLLIRPGATDYDDQRRIQGLLDVPLSQQGSREVAELTEQLRGAKIDAVYSCPSQAAMQTAEAIAELAGTKAKRLDGLQNLNYGLWQGMLVDEIRQKQPRVFRQWQESPHCICPPEGEMLGEAVERVEVQLAKLLKKHKNESIALVVPEPLASLIRHKLIQAELGDLWKAMEDHGRWETLAVETSDNSNGSRG